MRMLIAVLLAIIAPATAGGQQRIGAFTFEHSQDAITDVDQSSVSTFALGAQPLHAPLLGWRCDGPDKIELFIAADEFLNSEGPVRVIWRFDKRPPSSEQSWTVSTTGTAAFAPEEVIPAFTVGARSADQLVVRVQDYRGVQYDSRFSMNGATAALKRLPCIGAETALEARAKQQAEELAEWEKQQATLRKRKQDSMAVIIPTVLARADSFPWAAPRDGMYFYPTATYACWWSLGGDVKDLVFFRTIQEAKASHRVQAKDCRR